MNKLIRLLVVMAVAVAGLWITTGPALAATVPVVSECNTGWYVNDDEGDLLPTQEAGGFLFDGAKLVHHVILLDLADVKAGSFTADLLTGALPLFKMETSNPYTTINQTPDGKFWATAMNYADVGGQGNPVDRVADLVGKPTKPGKPQLTSDTKVVTFGVGYGSDAGNKALVKTITFHGTTYDLKCVPASATPSPTKTASPKPTPTKSVVAAPVVHPSTTPVAGAQLPVTGSPVKVLAWAGIGLLVLGGGLTLAARVMATKRRRFQA